MATHIIRATGYAKPQQIIADSWEINNAGVLMFYDADLNPLRIFSPSGWDEFIPGDPLQKQDSGRLADILGGL